MSLNWRKYKNWINSLELYHTPRLNQERKNLNRPITSKKIEKITKNISKNKNLWFRWA